MAARVALAVVACGASLTAATVKFTSWVVVVVEELLKSPVTVTLMVAGPFQSVAPVKERLFRKLLTWARVPVVPNRVPLVEPSLRVPLPAVSSMEALMVLPPGA